MSETFGQRLKMRRTARALSQYDLAEAVLGRRDRAGEVSRWEGDKNEPSHKNLILLAEFFNCSTDELLGVASSLTATTPTQEGERA